MKNINKTELICLSKTNLFSFYYLNLFPENNKTEDKSQDANEKKFKESKLLYKIMLF